MVEEWMAELTKLRGKIGGGARKPSFLSKTRERGQVKEKEEEKESKKELSKVVQKDSTLSEDSVVFMLMDRFAPL